MHRKGSLRHTQDPATYVQAYTRRTNYLPCYYYKRLCVEPVQDSVFVKTWPGGPPTAKHGLGHICA